MPDEMPPKRDDNTPGGPDNPNPMKFSRNMLFWVVLIILAMTALPLLLNGKMLGKTISADQFWTLVENGYVKQIVARNTSIEGELTDGAPPFDENDGRKFSLQYPVASDKEFQEHIKKSPNTITVTYKLGEDIWSFVKSLIMWLLLLLMIWFLFFRQIRNAAGGGGILGNFGRSRHRVGRREDTNTTFDDVAGIEEAKDEVSEIIQFLRNPQTFRRLGARIPRGVLLVGEPGCGKTLLAKAIAGEAEVPFFSISGSDFVEMFVGVGASRVRDLFKQAKENSPCIIFLDEIDAVGRRRGMSFSGGGHDEREQTLNAILVEMDGFDSNDQVIVIAATNRVDVLDPALTRPGRFDREIQVPLPDIKGRMDILKIYADRVRCGPDVDLQVMARGTPMFSGADLAALVNEAAIAATLSGKDYVEQADMEEARDKVRWGRARKSRVIDERERRMTAYHEAGHALVQLLLEDTDPLHKVSIIPRGAAGGATFSLPEKDRHMYTRTWCKSFISVAMAGRIAEEMFFGDIDSGAASDINQATNIARTMVMEWGMSEKLGFIKYNPSAATAMGEMPSRDYSDSTAEEIDAEVRRIIDECERVTVETLETNREKIIAIAEALLKYETLGAGEVKTLAEGGKIDKPTVDDLLAGERKRGEQTEDEKNEDREDVTVVTDAPDAPQAPSDDADAGDDKTA